MYSALALGAHFSKYLTIGKRLFSAGSMTSNIDDEYVEAVVCKDNEIGENEMKTFDLGEDGKVLLIRQNGKLSALGPKCTHYGAPLVSGALGDGRLRCQWHGACFNVQTGDIEDFPGLDSLPCHQVTVQNNEVKVRAKKSELASNKRLRAMAQRDPKNGQTIVVVGGGPAGATCVETLRQEGFNGQLIFVCKEPYLPYDRVKLSKAMDTEIGKIEFRTEQFYNDSNIDLLRGVEAVSVNCQDKTVELSNGSTVNYTNLFIATGMTANRAPIPGADLRNVVTLRSYDDAKHITGILGPEKEVVVLGASFIGMEVANYCLSKSKKVTVVARGALPFQPLFGERIGAACLNLFKEKGVNFIMNSGLNKCIDSNGNGAVTAVELADGTQMRADVVLMGVGSRCATGFLEGSGLNLRKDGTIEVDECLQSCIPNVYAGGDVAFAPVRALNGAKASIGHIGLAHYHGRIAALNMLGKRHPLRAVPYFWTMLFGKSFRYSGHGPYDDIVYTGNVEEFKFVAFYLKDDRVVAMSSCGMDPVVSKYAEILTKCGKFPRQNIENEPLAWTKN